MEKPNITFQEALKVVTQEIEKDELLKDTYKSTIAMCFFDSCRNSGIQFPQLHEISNKAADNFLSMWTKASKK